MENEILNENMNISEPSTLRNMKKNLTNNIFKKIKSPLDFINNNKNSTLKENKRRKVLYKSSNPAISNYNMNLLIDKMKKLKNLMFNTSDLEALLIIDKSGLRYSNEVIKNASFSKRIKTATPKNKINKKIENLSKINNKIKKRSTFKTMTINFGRKKTKRSTKRLIKMGETFDLSKISKKSEEKKFNQTFLNNSKKDKILYHLKTKLFLLERKDKITDNGNYNTGNKQNKNLVFIRENIDKEKYFYRIKSKFMKYNIKNRKKKNITFINNLFNNSNNSHSKTKNLSKYSYNDNNIIKIKIDENDNNKDINKRFISNKRLKETINSYKTKNNFIKNENNFNKNTNKEMYISNTPSVISPSLSLFNKSINKNIKDRNKIKIENKKKSFTFITNSNNSQDNTSLNSLNSSIRTSDMIHSLNKNNIKIIKQNYNKNRINSSKTRYKSPTDRLKKFKNLLFINRLNNLIRNSTKIKNNFLSLYEKVKLQKNEIFSKPDYTYKTEKLDIDKINNFFKFSKKEECDHEKIVIENAKKVKTTMDKKCGKILDDVIVELFYKDRKTNKKNYELSEYEKKLIKIKKEENYKKISNEAVLFEKKFDRDQIRNIFLSKDEEIKKLFKENKKDIFGQIDDLYNKYKVLKCFNTE